jgi:hypothetical protein
MLLSLADLVYILFTKYILLIFECCNRSFC